ncbi:MAG TPA: DUF4440 domain-containing protein [Lysobacter sp.]
MNKIRKQKSLLWLASLAFACGPVLASEAAGAATGCYNQFDVAQQVDMESFRDYDAETFRAGHTDDAVTIFANGGVVIGIDQVMAALAGHFANREAVWEWEELHRSVQGCDTAYILYETTYKIPRIGFVSRALVGVTYTHDGNKWLAVADQNTGLPPKP